MNLNLQDKVVLVTGGSRGLGLACTRAFAAEGARVGIVSRNPDHLEAARQTLAADGYTIVTAAADLGDAAQAQAAIGQIAAALGPIEVLINSAGATKRFAVDDIGPAAWHQGMDSKFFPYVNAIDAVRAGMVQLGRGAIVNLIGMGGKMGSPTHITGGAANAALMITTASWAAALAPLGIRVNGINPGPSLTDRLAQNLRATAQREGISEAQALEQMQAAIPLGRLAQPAEVAAVALFLASDQASYVTGATIPMDGGRYAGV